MKNFMMYLFAALMFFTFGTIDADSGGVSGKVTNQATGVAIDGATVQLQLLGITVQTATTSGGGVYNFNNINNGTYTVVCSYAGFQSATATNIIVLNSKATSNFQLAALGSISGIITNLSTGTAISGATVQMIRSGVVVASTTTSANGAYSITNLNPGSYTLSVSRNNFQTNTAAVSVSSSATTANLTLTPNTGTVSGAITSNVSLLGLTGATITFVNGGTTVATTTSGLLGAYSVSGLPPGTYSVSVNLAGYQTGTGTAVVTSDVTTTLNINLAPLNGILTGTVKNTTTGAVLAGATITVLQGSTVVQTVQSNAQGVFTVNDLKPGNYTVTTALSNYQTLTSSVTIVSNLTTTLNPLLQWLPGNVIGNITNSQTSVVLPGATITVSSGSKVVATTTADSSGNFSITGLAVGTYTLTASLNNFLAASQTITISANATVTQNLSLTPQVGIVTGIVQDLSSLSLLGGATVTLLQGNTVVATTTTSLLGVYSFSVLPGSYTIQVAQTNYVSATVAATVLSNATVTVNITLVASPGTVSGQIRDAVTLTALNGATVQVLQGSTVVATTTTNASGNYTITGIAPGTYTLSAGLTNYATGTAPLILVSNQTTTANLNLQPQNGSATGVVKDSVTLNPIQGAAVGFYQGSLLVASTTTNASGSYSISTLVPGSYTINVSATGYQSNQQAITIRSNTTTTTNINLQPSPGSVTGVITNAQTSGLLSGATVALMQGSTVVATTLTNNLGIYSFTGVVPGSYTLSVSQSNFTTVSQAISVSSNVTTTQNLSLQPQTGTVSGQISNNLTLGVLAGVTVNALQGSTIVATTTTNVSGNYSFNLAPGTYTITGLLTNFQTLSQSATVQSNVTTTLNLSLTPVPGIVSGIVNSITTTLPLSGVTVSVLQGSTTIATAQTNLVGGYTISNLSPGNFTIQFSLSNYQTISQPLTVTSNTTVTANASLTLQPGAIGGVVANGLNGSPLSGATVTAFQGAVQIATTTSGSNGSYALSGLAPGVYTVTASTANFQTGTQLLVAVVSNTTTTTNFTLQPVPGAVSGTITDNATTNPISGATVIVTQNGVTIGSTLSLANGTYSIANLAPGNYALVVSALNYQGATQSITINSNTTTTASVALLSSPGAIAGIVTNASNLAPISGATVQALNGSTVIATTTTASDGSYTITGLAPAASGVYTFRASATNFQTSTTTAAVIANVTTPLSFALVSQPGSLTGTITNSQTGGVISGASIQVMQGLVVAGSAVSNGSGVYNVTGLAPGSYTVLVTSTNFQNYTSSASIASNVATPLNVSLQPTPGLLSGTITDSTTSAPLVGAAVSVWNQGVLVATTLTAINGSYSIGGLTPGSYSVVISDTNYQNASLSASIFANQMTTLNQALLALPGSITGTVFNVVTPIIGATVTISQGNVTVASLTTNGSGVYSSAGLAPGNYTVTATAANFQTLSVGAIVLSNVTTTADLHLVSQPGTISGIITDTATLLPIPGAIVTALSGNVTVAVAVAANDGSYSLAGLAPGAYIITTAAINFQTLSQGANVQALTTTTVNLSLQAQPGTISGLIIDAVTLAPISGASVTVSQGNVLVSTTLTDSNGFYSVNGLAPGAYILVAQATNYQNNLQGVVVVSNLNTTMNVSLQSSPGIILGQVLDSSSNPISMAALNLYSNNLLVGTQIADAQGNFSFVNLAPGAYVVVSTAPNYQSASQTVNIVANGTKTISFNLQPDPGSCTCEVLDLLTSLPISGATVTLFNGTSVVATSVTNLLGGCIFGNIAPGSYTIRVSASNYQISAQGVAIIANQTATVAISLQLNAGAISGIITDFVTGLPISGANVDVIQGGVTVVTIATDSSGAYLANSLAPGIYNLRVSATNYQASLQIATVLPGVTTPLNLSLQPTPGNIALVITDSITLNGIAGASVAIYNPIGGVAIATGITDITGNCLISGLAPGIYNGVFTALNYQSLTLSITVQANLTATVNIALQTDPGSIACIVLDNVTTLPVIGCLVEALQGTTTIISAITDSFGACLLPGLTPGSYTLRVTAANYQISTRAVIVNANLQASVQVNLLSLAGTLEGTVLDVLSALVLPQAQLELFSGQTLIAATVSDVLGNYVFTGIAPGSYTLRVTLLNYVTLTASVTISANVVTHHPCSMHSQPGGITGIVTDAATTGPISGAVVAVFNGSTSVANVLTDSNGSYTVSGLSPNVSYTVRCTANNYQTAVQGVSVQSNQTKTVNFSLNAQPGAVVGQVTDNTTTAAIADATVNLMRNSVLITSTQTDSLGNYQLSSLAPGSYTLTVSANNYQTAVSTIQIQASVTTTADVALIENPGSLQGTITDANTALALPNVQIQLNLGSVLIGSFTTDQNGQYQINGIAPGQYNVTATIENYQIGVRSAAIQSNATTTVNFALKPNPGSVMGAVVDSNTMSGISGANVSLYQGSVLIASTTTDNSGSFLISNLAPGQYSVVATATNYQNSSQGIQIYANQTVSVNFSLVDQPGSIVGVVTDAIASVELLQGSTTVASTVCASDGSFSFSNLAPGNYTLRVQANNYQTVILGTTVNPNSTTNVTVTLLSQPGTISGQVLDATTSIPLSGVQINLIQNSMIVDSVLTDSSGNYFLGNLAPGSYIVNASLDTYQIAVQGATVSANNTTIVDFNLSSQPGAISGQVVDANTGSLLVDAEIDILQGSVIITSFITDGNGNFLVNGLTPGSYTVRATLATYETGLQSAIVAALNTTMVNFSLAQQPGSVTGQITDASTSLPIMSSSVVVNILQSNIVVASGITDSNGNYEINGLPKGSYSLQISAPNYQTAVQGITIVPNGSIVVNVALQPQPGTIVGLITDLQTSQPLKGAVIEVMQGTTVFASLITDVNGAYVASQLAPGNYIVRVSAANYQTGSQAAIVVINSTTTVNIQLQSQPGSLAGIVSDPSANAIPGAVILVKNGNVVVASVVADSVGNYLVTGLAPGIYTVFASASNYQTNFGSVTISANAIALLSFTLQPESGTSSGQITDTITTLAIPSAVVDILQNGTVVATTLTDINGNYSINGIAPGQYTLRVSATNYQTSIQGIFITANETTVINLALQSQPGSLAGLITDQLTTNPIANASIQIYQGLALVASVVTDATGAYNLSGLAPGNYTVVISAANYQNQTQGISIQANVATPFDISLLADPATLNGTITDSITANPISNASVQVLKGSTIAGSALTDANGNYTIVGLNPGSYTLNIFATNYQSSSTVFIAVANQISTKNISLTSDPGSLSGIVLDSVSNNSIPGATVTVSLGSNVITSQSTDSNGTWSVSNLAPGSYTIVITAVNYQSSTIGATVQANSNSAVTTLLIDQPGIVSGEVSSNAIGIAGATVEVISGNVVVASAITDSLGNYVINSLAPGVYTIRANASNYNTVVLGLSIQANVVTTSNFALIPNPGTIAGQVIDSITTQPVQGVTINVNRGNGLVASTVTDSNGNYQVISLSPGSYTLTTSSSIYQSINVGAAVVSNQTTLVNISLIDQPGTIIGQVVDQMTGLSLPGVTIDVMNGSIVTNSQISDSNGNYQFTGLATGSYTVRASINTYQISLQSAIVQAAATTTVNFSLAATPGSITGQITNFGGDPITGGSVVIHVMQGNVILASTFTDSSGNYLVNNLPAGSYSLSVMASGYQSAITTVVVLQAQTTIQNYVLSMQPGNVAGIVSDINGPLPGAIVQLYVNSVSLATVVSDSSGNYKISNIAPGQYTLQISAPDHQTVTENVIIVANTSTSANVFLQVNPGSISGVVIDGTTGLPLTGFIVNIYQSSLLISTVLTDSHGNFLINGVAPGIYSLSVIGANYQTGIQTVTVTAGSSIIANFALLSQPGSVIGTVLDSSSNPIVNALVEVLLGNSVVATAETDISGGFTLSGLAPGNYVVRANADLYQVALQGVTVQANAQNYISFTLQDDPGTVSGIIVDAVTLNPIAGSTIVVLQGSTQIASILSQSNGSYIIPNLPVGSYTIQVTAANYQIAQQGITVTANATITANLSLNASPGAISGIVVDNATASPIAGATVILQTGTTFLASVQTDTNGNYLINSLAPGIYTITASANSYETSIQSISVTPLTTTSANFSLMSQPGSISGSIINSGSMPIAGALVSVYKNQVIVGSALSDSSGNYTVNGLSSGSYTVTVGASSYQLASQGAIVMAATNTNISFTLSADTGNVSLTVNDPLLNPIGGATVTVSANQSTLATILTDANGNAVINQLAPGTYTITVTANGFQTSVQTVTVVSAATTTISYSLISNPGSIVGLVSDQSSNPLANATIQILENSTVIASALSASDGSFSVTGLAPGNYNIKVNLQGFQVYIAATVVVSGQTESVSVTLISNPGSISGTITSSSSGTVLGGVLVQVLQNTTVIASQQTDSNGNYVIESLAPGTYNLRVSDANFQSVVISVSVQSNTQTTANVALQDQPGVIQGLILDSITSAPVGNASVSVYNGAVLVASTATDVNGNYSIGSLAPNTYQVNIQAGGYQTAVSTVSVTAGATATLNFNLSTLTGTASGIVSNGQTSMPVAGASVSIYQGQTLISTTLTDANGNYTISGLSPGTYSVITTAANYQTNNQTITIVANTTVFTNISLATNPGIINGQISDAATSTNIVGATVQVSSGQTILASTLTDSNGNYAVNNLPEGTYTVTIAAPNYQTSVQSVTVTAGGTSVLTLALQPSPSSISGIVSDASSQPIGGASVYLLQNGSIISSTLTDASGSYTLNGIAGGSYSVQATAAGFQYGIMNINVPSSASITIDFSLLSNPGSIQGVVTDGTNPLANAFVQLLAGNVVVTTTSTDSIGNYSLANLPPAGYTIQASLSSYQTGTQGVQVTSGNTTTINFVLQTLPSTINGTVSNNSAQLLPGISVSAYYNGLLIASVLTNVNGQYVLTGLFTGNYVLNASGANYQTGTNGIFLPVNSAETVNFTLQTASGSVIGVLYDNNGAPIAGVTITVLQNNNTIVTTTTGADGTYIINGLSPGSYNINALDALHQGSTQGVTVIANQSVALDFTLQPQPSSFGGTIFDSLSNPVAGAQISVLQNGNVIATVAADNSGAFLITGLGSGNYTVVITAPNFQTSTIGIMLGAGEQLTRSTTLQSSIGSIQGIVSDLASNPLPNASVIISQSATVIANVFTDSTGHFNISNLSPGSYSVTAGIAGYQTSIQGAIVNANASTTVNFALTIDVGQVAGIITDFNLGTPIAGAIVSIYSQGVIAAAGVTDTNGQYLIGGLAAGSYIITIEAPNYQTSSQAVVVQINSTTTASIGLLSNPGKVLGTVSGNNVPLVNAAVSISVLQGNTLISSTLTDGNGHYMISGLQPGSYVIKANAMGYQIASQGVSVLADQTVAVNFNLVSNPGTIYGTINDAVTTGAISGALVQILQGSVVVNSGLTDASGNFLFANFAPGNYVVTVNAANYQIFSTSVQVVSDQTVNTTISLQGNPGSINGIVLNASSLQPIAGAVIDLIQGLNLVASTQTDAYGQYVIQQLAPGSYTIRVSAAGYQTVTQGGIITAGNAIVENFELQIQPSTLTGNITDATTLQPVVGASVQILQGNNLIASALTDANGNFTVSGLANGSYSVQLSANNYQTTLTGATLIPDQTTSISIALNPNPGSVVGVVTDSFSQPITGAVVSVDILVGNILVAQTLTDVNGSYTIANLAAGSYTIQASAANYQTAFIGLIVVSGQTTTANFALQANPGSLTGIISDASTTNAIPGVVVSIFSGSVKQGSATTDSNGAYLISGLAPGVYTISTSAQNYQAGSLIVTVVANTTTFANIALQADPGTFKGIVTGFNGEVVVGAIVTVSNNGVTIASAVTSSDGSYQIGGLPSGTYIITATAANYQTASLGASVGASETITQNFVLQINPGQLAGNVFDTATSQPIGNAVITLIQNNIVITNVLSNNLGNFLIQNLAPGTYTVKITASGFQTVIENAIIAASQTTTINPGLLANPGTLQGTVLNNLSQALVNANIQLFQNSMLVAQTNTDSNGFYIIQGLSTGEYSVVATVPGYAASTNLVQILNGQISISDFTLDSAHGSISGTVSDAVTGNRVPGATVSLYTGSTLIGITLTDANGVYSFSSVPVGTKTIIISQVNYQTQTDTVLIADGQNTVADEILNPLPGTLTGIVTDELTGLPVKGVTVTVFSGGVIITTTLTDAQGVYVVAGLSPGSYDVTFTAPLYIEFDAEVTINTNATTVLNVIIEPFPTSPATVVQCKIKTEFLTQKEYSNRIEWTASTSPSVTQYYVYRDGKVIARLPSTVLYYVDHNVGRHSSHHYAVSAVNSLDNEGIPTNATVGRTDHCHCR